MLRGDEVGRRQVLHRPQGADMQQPAIARGALIGAFASTFLSIVIGLPTVATADEGGVSFWLPGFFGAVASRFWSDRFSVFEKKSQMGGCDFFRAIRQKVSQKDGPL